MDLEYGCKVSNRYTAFLDADNQPVGLAASAKARNCLGQPIRAPVRLRDREQQRKPRGRNPADIIIEMCDRLTKLRPNFAALDENLLFPSENGEMAAPSSTPELSNGESTGYPDSLPDEPTNPNWSELCCAEEEALRHHEEEALRNRGQTVPADRSRPSSHVPEHRLYPTMYFYNRNFRHTFRDRQCATQHHRSQVRSDPGQDENDPAARKAAADKAAFAHKYPTRRKRSKRYTKRRPATAHEQPVAEGAANEANRNNDDHGQKAAEPTSSDQTSAEEKPVRVNRRLPRSLTKRRSTAS